jgi:hypothetical protein
VSYQDNQHLDDHGDDRPPALDPQASCCPRCDTWHDKLEPSGFCTSCTGDLCKDCLCARDVADDVPLCARCLDGLLKDPRFQELAQAADMAVPIDGQATQEQQATFARAFLALLDERRRWAGLCDGCETGWRAHQPARARWCGCEQVQP